MPAQQRESSLKYMTCSSMCMPDGQGLLFIPYFLLSSFFFGRILIHVLQDAQPPPSKAALLSNTSTFRPLSRLSSSAFSTHNAQHPGGHMSNGVVAVLSSTTVSYY